MFSGNNGPVDIYSALLQILAPVVLVVTSASPLNSPFHCLYATLCLLTFCKVKVLWLQVLLNGSTNPKASALSNSKMARMCSSTSARSTPKALRRWPKARKWNLKSRMARKVRRPRISYRFKAFVQTDRGPLTGPFSFWWREQVTRPGSYLRLLRSRVRDLFLKRLPGGFVPDKTLLVRFLLTGRHETCLTLRDFGPGFGLFAHSIYLSFRTSRVTSV